jgi:hypothetical protein
MAGPAASREVCAASEQRYGRMNDMDTVDLSEERRRRRRAGDPRVTDADRELMRRITTGDLADEFQAALDSDLVNDPILGGTESDDE